MEISTKKISRMRLSFETQLFTSGKKKMLRIFPTYNYQKQNKNLVKNIVA